jgi:putative ABC transport system substrate-binding protein
MRRRGHTSSCPARGQACADCINLSACRASRSSFLEAAKTWMAGTIPAMTERVTSVDIGRRQLITLLGGATAASSLLWPLAARAQQGAMPVIGYLSSLTQADSVPFDAAFRRGLSETGYAEGRNVSMEYRWITDRYDLLPAMAADLVQRKVTMIGALGPPAVLAAKAATSTIPIIFVTGADPIKFGFVASFNRPGGNITGIWVVSTVLAQKRLQLVRELLPKAELIALLVNPTSPVAEPQTRDAQAAAETLGLKLIVLNAVIESDFDQVFAALLWQRADALFISADPFLSSRREQLVGLAARHAIPTLYEIREFVEAGGLMSYGTVLREGYYKGGIYAGRILKGANPAELPVEQVNKLELVINLKTARALGLEIPPTLLATADEVIE